MSNCETCVQHILSNFKKRLFQRPINESVGLCLNGGNRLFKLPRASKSIRLHGLHNYQTVSYFAAKYTSHEISIRSNSP